MNKLIYALGITFFIILLFKLTVGNDTKERRDSRITTVKVRKVDGKTDENRNIVMNVKSLPEYEHPEVDPFDDADGVSYWHIWYTKGDDKEYSGEQEQPYKYFSVKYFKDEYGEKSFVTNYMRVHKETTTNNDTETSDTSYWFVYASSKTKGMLYNMSVDFPHKHFSQKGTKEKFGAEFKDDVFIKNFKRITKEQHKAE